MACAFNKYKINLSDLEEFINWVDTPDFVLNKHDGNIMFKTNKKKQHTKTYREYLAHCDDPENKELKERESDEENEHVYDYFPLMIRPQPANITAINELSMNISLKPLPITTDRKSLGDSASTSVLANAGNTQQMDISTSDSTRLKSAETLDHIMLEAEKTKEIVKNGTT